MAHLGIDTAQNVHLEYEVASIGDRLLAVIIDFVILIGWTFAAGYMVDALHWYGTIPYILLFGFPWTFYHLLCEQYMDGQSIGKRVRGIKVVRRDGREAGLGAYLLRWVLRPLDSFYGIGVVVMLVNGKGQRLGDLAAGTTVVTLRKRVRLNETLLVEVPVDHIVRYPRAIELTDGQARFMKDVLRNTKGGERPRILAELAGKLRTRLSIDHELSDEALIDALLKDYIHLTGK